MKKRYRLILSLMAIFMVTVAACGGTEPAAPAEPDAAVEEAAEEVVEEAAEEVAEEAVEEDAAEEMEEDAAEEEMAEEAVEEAAEEATGERTQVRWFVGLGAGSDQPMFEPQEQVVADFNASQDEIELVLEIVDADQAYTTLATQIAAGNAPDIVGPVGIRGRDFFRGAWMDLDPYIQGESYDLSDFDPNLVQFYVDQAEGQLGLPFAIFPSYLSYNIELFDEAGIPYPPAEYGAPYTNIDGEEVAWDIAAMRDVALLLTVDANGNDATSADFDAENIVQFGYYEQWTDFRGAATLFGAGSLVADDGTAQVPDHWRDAANWFYDGMWNDVFYPNGAYDASDVIAGNGFEAGNVAMSHTHLWYYGCCVGNIGFDYNFAAMPANASGQATAKMHADTFGILKDASNPDGAWEVLKFFLGDNAETMTTMYGGMPARLSLQDTYFETFAGTVPSGDSVDWQVVVDSMGFADNPNHEAYMPSPQEANDRYNEFWSKLAQEPGLDVDAEIDTLVADLQAIYDAAGAPAEDAAAEEAEEETAEAAPAFVSPTGEPIEVRWFVGLGAGSDQPMFEPQEQVVADFNASQDQIELVLEIVDADQAYSTLATQIAAGNAPAIVGPVGIRGRDFFRGAWLDLGPFIEGENYDLSDFDPNLVQFYVDQAEGQLGLPFAIFPSYLSYNIELFDEAGIPYPPAEYGAPYTNIDGEEVAWDIAAMRDVALLLTVDANGNDATSADFDAENIVQFGYYEQWTDFRGAATLFGPGSLVADDGSAQVPDHWVEAAKWFYDGMWNDVFYPNGAYDASDVIAGNGFEAGNVAMSHTHLWYYGCCVGNIAFDYDFAAMPANATGQATSKMHADTFGILKDAEYPEAAWEVLKFFLGDNAETMTQMYGGMPARLSLQDTYFETFAGTVPSGDSVDWQVVVDSMGFADNPNHEAYMPSPQEANDRYNEFWALLAQEPGLDVDAEIESLVADLQAIYDAAGE